MTLEKQVHEQEVEIRKLKQQVKELTEKLKVLDFTVGTIHEWKLQKEGI